MKRILPVLSVLMIVFCLTIGKVSATPYTNWSVSLDGGANFLTVPNFLSVSGLGYIENTPTGNPDEFTFEEWAVFQTLANNFGETIQDAFGNYQLTGSLYGEGTVAGGEFFFTDGTLDLYVDTPRSYGTISNDLYGAQTGDLIASFDIVSGGGFVNADTTPIGSVNTQFVSSFLDVGYFFDPDGNDIALQGYPIEWLFALTNVTASYNNPDAINPNFSNALLDTYGITASDDVPFSFFISNSGEFTIGVVPEPTTMLLFGIGLLGAAGISRRKMA